MRLAEASEAFVGDLAALGYAATTARQRRSQLGRFVRWAEDRGVDEIGDVGRGLIEQYQRGLFLARKKDGSPLTRRTQAELLGALVVFFRWARRRGFVEVDPAADIVMPRVERSLPRTVLSPEQVREVIAACPTDDPLGLRDRALLSLMYSTGVRRDEVRHVAIPDLDVDGGTLRVRWAKGGQQRVVAMGQAALDDVHAYMQDGRPLLVRHPVTTTLFLSARGAMLSNNGVHALVKRVLGRAGIEGACHVLRHACGSHMLDGGAGIRHVQEQLGHRHIDSTATYTRVSVAKLKAVHETTHPSKPRRSAPTDRGTTTTHGATDGPE